MLQTAPAHLFRRTPRQWLEGLYGYDFFISYRQRSCAAYATALHAVLTSGKKPLAVFIDSRKSLGNKFAFPQNANIPPIHVKVIANFRPSDWH